MGKKEGNGVYKFLNGKVYDGAWKNGLQHGKGKIILPSGEIYEGEWK